MICCEANKFCSSGLFSKFDFGIDGEKLPDELFLTDW